MSQADPATEIATAPPAIQARNLWKKYRIYPTAASMLIEALTGRPRHQEVWAVKDVNFGVNRGEVVGLIGRNGAGKSTLLKIITGVAGHDTGDIRISGRVSAILELGAGFNPEYSGLDNVRYGALCQGMTPGEVEQSLEGIVEFAELRDVIDRPFKTYSSGMKSRLLFSTAIAVDSEILIIDEALSAGDMLFQEKCFRRMREIAASGRTVFFVTHSLGQIYELCTRAMLMHRGEIIADGEPRHVGYEYERLLIQERVEEMTSSTPGRTLYEIGNSTARPDGKAHIERIECLNAQGDLVSQLFYGEPYVIRVRVKVHDDLPRLAVGLRIDTIAGTAITSAGTSLSGLEISGKAGDKIDVRFHFVSQFSSTSVILNGGVSELVGSSFVQIHVVRAAQELVCMGSGRSGGYFDLDARIEFDLRDGEHEHDEKTKARFVRNERPLE